YDRHRDKCTPPSLDELLELETVAAANSKIFVVVDAHDGCQLSNGCRQKFLSGIFRKSSRPTTLPL
ncbi:hypothetical protein BJ878DRAFT_394234, partial [Calycina marina]